jgi:hypothetical protein
MESARPSTCRRLERTQGGTDVGLKSFHLFFIAMSVILAAFTAAWSVTQYRATPDMTYIGTCAVSAVAGAALIVYGAKFQRKARRL